MALISRHSGLTPIASEAFVALLRVAGQLQRDLDDACHEFGLTHDQYNVLRILRGVHPEGHPRFEIAARLVRRAPDVTRLIDRLERRGWVRRASPSCARSRRKSTPSRALTWPVCRPPTAGCCAAAV
jgi:hypothetical protein